MLTYAATSRKANTYLADSLIHAAELAYNLSDLEALDEASQILINLPVSAARKIGQFYQGLTLKRKGLLGDAQVLFETVSSSGPAAFRARAIQALGAVCIARGDLSEALRFQIESVRCITGESTPYLEGILTAQTNVSVIRSLSGDHRAALRILNDLAPLVRSLSKRPSVNVFAYHNELAIELGELGRLEEARAAIAIAINSPFAAGHPEWHETRDELEAKRVLTSSLSLAPQVRRETHSQPILHNEPEPERLKLGRVRDRNPRAKTARAITYTIGGGVLLFRSAHQISEQRSTRGSETLNPFNPARRGNPIQPRAPPTCH